MTDSPDALRAAARAVFRGALPFDDLVTGGQPTAVQLAALAAAGVRTVLDLRAPDEERAFPEAAEVERLGMHYAAMPFDRDAFGDEEFTGARARLNDPARRPMFVHCGSGDRTGAVMLPWLVLDAGRTWDEAFDLSCVIGLRNAGYVERALDYVERHS